MTSLRSLQQAAHVLRWYPGGKKETLRCFRCGRHMPQDQFAPMLSNRSPRMVAGQGGKGNAYVQYLHPWCFTCKKQAYGEHVKHPHYSPKIDRYWTKRISSIKAGGKTRQILVLVDKDDLLGACLSQGNRCAITRVPMSFDMAGEGYNKYTQASVDRIDSGSNYAVNNIQIVCTIVNIMKHDLPQREFMRWCARVLDGRRQAENELLDATDIAS